MKTGTTISYNPYRFFLFLLIFSLQVYPSDAIYLKSKAYIKSKEVYLSHIARLPDGIVDIPIFETPSSPVIFSPSDVAKLLPKELSDRKVFGSDCYIIPLNKKFTKEEIEESFFRELVIHYNKKPDAIRVQFTGEDLYFPDRGVELRWGNLPKNLSPGQKIFTLDAYKDEKRIYSVRARFLLEEKVQTPIASRKIGRFEVLADGDIIYKETFVSENLTDIYNGPLIGITALSNLDDGEIIKKRHVREIHKVEKGSGVDIYYAEGNLVVVTRATARESGNTGQKIKVQSKSSGVILTGIISGDGKVLIE